jgi:hypothetical protein
VIRVQGYRATGLGVRRLRRLYVIPGVPLFRTLGAFRHELDLGASCGRCHLFPIAALGFLVLASGGMEALRLDAGNETYGTISSIAFTRFVFGLHCVNVYRRKRLTCQGKRFAMFMRVWLFFHNTCTTYAQRDLQRDATWWACYAFGGFPAESWKGRASNRQTASLHGGAFALALAFPGQSGLWRFSATSFPLRNFLHSV